MKKIGDLNKILSSIKEDLALTIGNFDGVHIGHQELIKRLTEISKQENLKSVLVTFVPHPRSILNQDKKLYLLTSYTERAEALAKLGIDYLVEIHFSRDFSTLTPADFIEKYLHIESGRIKHILLGHDFNFGAKKQGDFNFVKNLVKEKNIPCNVEQFSAYKLQDKIVSSSFIRGLIQSGRIREASEHLGYDYAIQGRVIRCRGVGKQIGFPTANIESPAEKIIPPNGVYCTKTISRGIEYFSITNIGHNPTLGNFEDIRIETHLLDFNEDIYGENITVSFLQSIRSEKKFSGVAELVNQIAQDKAFCLNFFKLSR